MGQEQASQTIKFEKAITLMTNDGKGTKTFPKDAVLDYNPKDGMYYDKDSIGYYFKRTDKDVLHQLPDGNFYTYQNGKMAQQSVSLNSPTSQAPAPAAPAAPSVPSASDPNDWTQGTITLKGGKEVPALFPPKDTRYSPIPIDNAPELKDAAYIDGNIINIKTGKSLGSYSSPSTDHGAAAASASTPTPTLPHTSAPANIPSLNGSSEPYSDLFSNSPKPTNGVSEPYSNLFEGTETFGAPAQTGSGASTAGTSSSSFGMTPNDLSSRIPSSTPSTLSSIPDPGDWSVGSMTLKNGKEVSALMPPKDSHYSPIPKENVPELKNAAYIDGDIIDTETGKKIGIYTDNKQPAGAGASGGSAASGAGSNKDKLSVLTGKDGKLAGTLVKESDSKWLINDKEGNSLGTYSSEKSAQKAATLLKDYGKVKDISLLERVKAHPQAAFIVATAVAGLALQWDGSFTKDTALTIIGGAAGIGGGLKALLNLSNLQAGLFAGGIILAIGALKNFGKKEDQGPDNTKDPSLAPNSNTPPTVKLEPAPTSVPRTWFQRLGKNAFTFAAGAAALSVGLNVTDSKVYDSKPLSDSAASAFQQELGSKVIEGSVPGAMPGKIFTKAGDGYSIADQTAYVTKNVGENSGYTVHKRKMNPGGYALGSPLGMHAFFLVNAQTHAIIPNEAASTALGTQNAHAAGGAGGGLTPTGAATAIGIGAMQGHDVIDYARVPLAQ